MPQASSPLAGRYRFLKRLSAGPPRAVWLAEDLDSGILVIVVRIASRAARLLEPVLRVQHPHLACLLDIVLAPSAEELPKQERQQAGSPYAVAQWISGQTLYDALMEGPFDKCRAVQTVASLASALSAIHNKKAFHSAISARTVVVERIDEGAVPILTQVIMPADASYACPERLAGKGPGRKDDVWALHVLLYAALTGQRPFRAQTREGLLQVVEAASPAPLAAFGMIDTRLQSIIDRGFDRDISLRTTSVQRLEMDLFAWLSKNSREQAIPLEAIAQADRILEAQSNSGHPDAATQQMPAVTKRALASMTANPSPLGEDTANHALLLPSIYPPDARDTWRPPADALSARPPEPEPQPPVPPRAAPQPPPSLEAHPPYVSPDAPTVVSARVDSSPPPAKAKRRVTLLPLALTIASLCAVAAVAVGYAYFTSDGLDLDAPLVGPDATTQSTGSAPPALPTASLPTTASPSTASPSAASPSAASPSPASPSASSLAAASPSAPSPATSSPGAPSPTPSQPPSSKRPPSSATVDSRSLPPLKTPTDASTCVAQHFSPETFASKQELSFVCEQSDPRAGAQMMRTKIVLGGSGKLTEGMTMWSRMGWHELAAYGMLRRKCCDAPVELPDKTTICPALSDAINSISRAYVKGEDLTTSRAAFISASTCAHRLHDPSFSYRTGPLSGGQVAFAAFVKRNATRR